MVTLPQAAGGFGNSDGSTCWGREEGSVGQGTPTQALLVPPPPQGWALSPKCWPARPIPPTSLPFPAHQQLRQPSPAENGETEAQARLPASEAAPAPRVSTALWHSGSHFWDFQLPPASSLLFIHDCSFL